MLADADMALHCGGIRPGGHPPLADSRRASGPRLLGSRRQDVGAHHNRFDPRRLTSSATSTSSAPNPNPGGPGQFVDRLEVLQIMELLLIALTGVTALAPLLYAATVFIAYRSASYNHILLGGASIATLGAIAVPVVGVVFSLSVGVRWFDWIVLGGWWFVAGLAMVVWGAVIRLAFSR